MPVSGRISEKGTMLFGKQAKSLIQSWTNKQGIPLTKILGISDAELEDMDLMDLPIWPVTKQFNMSHLEWMPIKGGKVSEEYLKLPKVSLRQAIMFNDYNALDVTSGARLARYDEHLVQRIGEMNPNWHRLNVIGGVVMDALKTKNSVALRDILTESYIRLNNKGLAADDNNTIELLNYLVEIGLLKHEGENYKYADGITPELMATQTEPVHFIRSQLEDGVDRLERNEEGASDKLTETLVAYASAADVWFKDPVESRWPLLKAVTLMEKKKRETLLDFIKQKNLRLNPTLNSILLMYGAEDTAKWLRKECLLSL
jgi:hypothetical protein